MTGPDEYPHVNGHCPACGKEQLVLVGSDLMCLQKGCSAPDTATKLLADSETEHVVRFDESGFFTVRHPLRERVGGSLFDCGVHSLVSDMCEGFGGPGEGLHRLVFTPEVYVPGGPDQEPDYHLEPIE